MRLILCLLLQVLFISVEGKEGLDGTRWWEWFLAPLEAASFGQKLPRRATKKALGRREALANPGNRR